MQEQPTPRNNEDLEVIEFPAASGQWEALDSGSATRAEYRRGHEQSQRKIKKMKVRIETLLSYIELQATQVKELHEEKEGLVDRLAVVENLTEQGDLVTLHEEEMRDLSERLRDAEGYAKYELSEKMKYWEALTAARREIEVLKEEGEGGLCAFSQNPRLCSPLP